MTDVEDGIDELEPDDPPSTSHGKQNLNFQKI